MMEFPLAERELARAAKRRSTYILRVAPVGVVCVVLFLSPRLIVGGPASEGAASFVASLLLGMSRLFHVVVVFLVAPVLTAGLIAKEKQDRTLTLLVLADFRGWDVFFAKFISAFLQVELLVLSMLPLMAFGSFLGGISVPGAALQVFLFSLAALATCSLGLLCSTVTRRPADALLVAVFLIAGWLAGTAGLDKSGLTRGLQANIMRAAWSPGGWRWWPSAVVAGGIAVAFSLVTIRLLPRQAGESPVRRITPRRAAWRRRRARKANPVAELLFSGEMQGLRFASPMVRLPAMVGLALVAATMCGQAVVHVVAFYALASSLAAARHGAALQDLLAAPVGSRAIARAMFRTQLRRGPLFFPALFVGNGWLFGLPMMETLDALFRVPYSQAVAGVVSAIMVLMAVTILQWRLIVGLACEVSTTNLSPAGQTIFSVLAFWGGHVFILTVNSVALEGSSGASPVPQLAAIAVVVTCVTACYGGGAAFMKRLFLIDTSWALRWRETSDAQHPAQM
jgi:ABC-2 family transporter protein